MVVNSEMLNGLYPLRSTPFGISVAQSTYLLPPPFRYILLRYTRPPTLEGQFFLISLTQLSTLNK